MTLIGKYLIFTFCVALVYSRSVSWERNTLENSQDTNCSCDWRYFKHYETKGCLLEKTDSCGCPEKFACPFNETQLAPVKVCLYKNKEYKVGSKIITSDVCQVCRCRDGIPPHISCITRECPEIEGDISDKDCHPVFKENSCCPVRIECVENETEFSNNKSCEYNGKYYPFGSKIYPVDDPCQICICDESWNGVDNASCRQQECIFERNKSKLNAGCIPVYHESRCCPIEFYCPSSHNLSYSVLTSNESSENYNISYENQCTFADQFYELGEELFINNPCVKCSCNVPPDFTCIHQTCSPSPSNENCYAIYTAGECCPSYECMLGDSEAVPEGCPTPLCADSSCRIETPPGHECPTCVCGERFSELEHNNLEQVQQISQNMDQFELIQQTFETGDMEDSSESDLQLMPIRIQDSEGQSSPLEKMILPESESTDQFTELIEELQNNSLEDNSSTEAVSKESEIQLTNFTSMTEPELNDTYEPIANQSEIALQKRSDVSDAANPQTRVTPIEQDVLASSENLEREGSDSEGNHEEFDDELESFKNKVLVKNKTIINEIINIEHLVKVPPICPTPMCEGPWCKVGIPPGEKCPTCICKRNVHNEP